MLKRISWVAVAVCLLGVSILLALQQSLYPWPKRLRHVRLEPSRPILRDADVTPDNAFFYVRQLTGTPFRDEGVTPENTFFGLRQLTGTPSRRDDWSTEYHRFCDLGMAGGPYPALEARLTEIAASVDLCRQAAAQPKWQVVTAESRASRLPYLAPVHDIVNNLQFRAERAATEGDWAAASDACRLALRTGDGLSRGGGLSNYALAYSCCAMTCQSLRRVIIEADPPLEFLRGTIQVLDELDRNTEPLAETMRYERLMARNVVPEIIKHPSSTFRHSHVFLPPSSGELAQDWLLATFVYPELGSTSRRTAAHLDTIYSYVIDIATEPRPSGRSVAEETIGFLAGRHEPIRLVCDDPLGRLLATMLVPGLDNAAEKYRAYVATLRGTELVLALRLYQRTHDGKLPARLEELVPDCLSAVPIDPFNPAGESFRYRADTNGKWIVYSYGPYLGDDGGWFLNYPGHEYFGPKFRPDIAFSATEPEQCRDNWRLEHPGEK